MEAAPPSYEKAVKINEWDIIAQYIPSSDLCSAALVCSAWHAIFVPHLWGNPASHFGQENDRVYAHAEIYNGPKSDWLREVLDRLPNLQSLIVRGLPFFDHSALVTLKYTTPAHVPSLNSPPTPSGYVELPGSIPFTGTSVAPAAVPSTFGLRLLDASRCTNVTSSGLCHALRRFDNLLYLNLSWTFPARDTEVLRCFRHFSGLQVLKLRGVNLRDDDIEVLAWAIGRRVRSLDIGHNQLTDRSVRTLLGNCFLQGGDGDGSAAGDRSPVLLHYLGVEMLATYRGEDFERYLRNAFTTHFVSRLAIEDAPEGGITHLYISDNKLSVEGVSGLLRSGKQRIGNPSSPPPTQGFDVVAKIAEFRKSRKAAYETSLACGENDPEVEGYWPGLVQVVRPSQHQDPHVQNDEFMDYYGNRFSKNYLYR
ncbi:hypothetical protein H2203_005422 [Taxawa tesnikishii (nom. ined.)]|nr:hypothetical protein H2203_005422 [Dothideales sp. JES 119]